MRASGHSVRGRGRPRIALLALGSAAAMALAAPAGGLGAPTVVYGTDEAANAIHAGTPGNAGLRGSLRQAPPTDNPRWPPGVQLGKASGNELAELPTARAMADYLRANQRRIVVNGQARPIGGWVGVDEIRPKRWTAERSRRLRRALDMMGPHQHRVVFYVISAYVEQSGRPRLPQRVRSRNAVLRQTLASGGHTFFQLYRSTLQPTPTALMSNGLRAIHSAFPRAQRHRLHVLIGPSRGATQGTIFARVRQTAAGRRMLSNGPGSFGLTSAGDGRDWLAAYRAFQRSQS